MRRLWVPLVCAALQTVAVATGGDRQGPTATVLFTVLGIATGAALLGRDRWPLTLMAVCAAGYALQVLLVGPPVPAAVAVLAYGLNRAPQPQGAAIGWPLLAPAGALLVPATALVATGQVWAVAPLALVVVVSVGAGLATSGREARAEAERRRLLARQRLDIARDLHDIVGHGAAAITVQAGAARMALAAGASADAERALTDIEAAGRALLREVRFTVGLLRDGVGAPRLSELPTLVEGARRSGLRVHLTASGLDRLVPASVGEAAYRIVQESLTNLAKHGGSGRGSVDVDVDPDAVRVRVSNPDRRDRTAALEGHGLTGMRERAAAVGGTLSAGPHGHGWTVCADLPLGVTHR